MSGTTESQVEDDKKDKLHLVRNSPEDKVLELRPELEGDILKIATDLLKRAASGEVQSICVITILKPREDQETGDAKYEWAGFHSDGDLHIYLANFSRRLERDQFD